MLTDIDSPLEQSTPHDIMVKFFPWPGLRNKMAVNLQPFRNEEWADDFNTSASFLFPSLNDAFSFDERTNRFTFTPLFLKCRNDLTCYTCTSDFLAKYPDLQSIIPVSTARVRVVQPTGMGCGIGPPSLLLEALGRSGSSMQRTLAASMRPCRGGGRSEYFALEGSEGVERWRGRSTKRVLNRQIDQ